MKGEGGGRAVEAARFQSWTDVKFVMCLDLIEKRIFFDPGKKKSPKRG